MYVSSQVKLDITGKTGQVVIDQNADRLINFEVYSFGPGNDSYYRYMRIDVSKPVTEARD